ncbi:type II toxin-antitoxin system RelE/ParE family toxin [Rhizobium sp. AG855]|uniref:type II toxin-antitoxin system RelE/ParE family toxin n=1 Tax=Rhizobium sp. AG855 TaxID=2183898 RepID=UPI000E71D97C|nr:type II toxin-antitoxin system RelE/ParE family toxin [Rhizobium sp. AG855]RKE85920.1 toxin ParE1/3/4 [Rhizobium sp. AG855]
MSGYRLRPIAEEDMDAIWDYTCRSRSAARADRYIDDLFDAFERLVQTPELGQKAFLIAAGYRRLRVNHHLIFYRRTEDNGIEVVRIIHERADHAGKLDE